LRICAVMYDGKRYQTNVDEKDDLIIAVGQAIVKFREEFKEKGISMDQVKSYTMVGKNDKFDGSVRERLKIYRKKRCSKCGEFIIGKSKRGEVDKETGKRVWLCINCAKSSN